MPHPDPSPTAGLPPAATAAAADRTPPAPTLGDRFKAGGWYFVLAIGSAGIFSGVPFWHSAVRLGRPALWRPAIVFSLFGVVFLTVSSLIPQDADGEPVGTAAEFAQNVLMMVALVVIVVACLQLRSIRRESTEAWRRTG